MQGRRLESILSKSSLFHHSYWLEQDPYGFTKGEIKDLKTLRLKEVNDLRKNWTPCYIIIMSLLSPEIETAIHEIDGYTSAASLYDPLLLYLLSIEAATGDGPAESKVLSSSASREPVRMEMNQYQTS